MAIFTNNYSMLITRGLGGPACCTLLTASFGLVCGCTVQVVEPPTPGGGGGSFAVEPGIYVPWPKANLRDCDRVVVVTVKFSPEKVWRKSYAVDVCNVNRMVKVINIVNAATRRLAVGVENVKHAARRVTALFKRGADK